MRDIFHLVRMRESSPFHGALALAELADHPGHSTAAPSSPKIQLPGSCHCHGNEHTVHNQSINQLIRRTNTNVINILTQ